MKNTENAREKLKDFVKRVEDRTNDVLDDSLMDEDASSEQFDVNYTDIVKNSTKAKMSKLPWLIAICLILVIAIMLGLMFFKNNPKTLFTQTVDGLFDFLESNINDNVYDITDGNISLDYSIKSNDENMSLYENMSKVDFDADYIKDNAGDRSYINLKTTYDGEDFISANIYGDGNDTYIYSPNVADNYIKLSSNKLSYFGDGNDIKVILKGLNQAIDKIVADEKIYGKKQDVDIDGKIIKGYKIGLVIDSKNRNRVAETFINTLKANDELLTVVSKLKGVKTSDVKNSLENYLSKLKEELKKHEKLEILLYIDNQTNEFIKAETVSKLGNIVVTGKKDNQFSFTISNTNDGILTTGDFSFSVNDNKNKYVYDLYLKQTKNGKLLLESNVDLKYTSKKADSFQDVDVSNSAEMSKLTELERLSIYAKILGTPNLGQFLPLIKEII